MDYRTVAQSFGALIAHRDYSGAWDLLTKEAQRVITPEGIKTAAMNISAYAPRAH